VTRRIAFINEKGGTGKTTLAVNVAAWLAQKKGRRVLLVDLDTQGHVGKSLGIDARRTTPNVFHLLTQGATLEQVTRDTAIATLKVVPSWKEMAEFAAEAATRPERAQLLNRALAPAAGRFDVVVFDAPPSMGLVTTNILVASTEAVIPVATTYLSLDGCAEMVETIERVRKEYNHPSLAVSLVVPTLYRKTQLSDEVVAKLKEYFPGRVAEPVALNVSIDEAQSHGKTIWEYAPWSRGATMMQTVAERVDRAKA